MKNFENLFAAWMVVWAVFFIYEVSMKQDIESLKQQVRER
jgi:hypothetical protein